jgi:hypothetical protein
MAFWTKRNELMFLSSVRVAELFRAGEADRNIGIATKAAFFHVAVADFKELQESL